MKTIKVLFAALVMTLSLNTNAQLTSVDKAKIEVVASAMMWWDLKSSIDGSDTTYYLSFIDQRYPNLRPTEVLYLGKKDETIDFLNGVINITDDAYLTGKNFRLSNSNTNTFLTLSNGSETTINKKQAQKALTKLLVY
jgi:hypothetical protein